MPINSKVHRIFGGDGNESRNEASQAAAETPIVGTTRRVFKGPQKRGHWSYHLNNLSASGATSTVKFYYSNLPNPDPTIAAHWVDSGITAIDLTVVATSMATKADVFVEWIKAEAVVVTTAGTLWGYVRSEGDEV